MWHAPEITNNKLTEWNWMVTKCEHFVLGSRTDIGAFCYIMAAQGVTIEDEVQIGSHCSIYSVNSIDETQGSVLLKRACKIGSHSTIMPGVTIGENSIVGAYSLVKCDIPANEVWYGIPAIFRRFLDRKF